MFRQWSGNDEPPSMGLAVKPDDLAHTMKIIGRDELSVQRLAEVMPQTTELARSALEKVIDVDQRGHVLHVVARIGAVSRAVAHLSTDHGAGTGFMITRDLLMTNNHVFVGDEERVATPADGGGVAMFNYEQDVNGAFARTKQYTTAPDRFFAASHELDYAVVHVDGEPGDEWGTIQLPSDDATVAVGDDVFIVQHPNGGPKQIALAGNVVAYVDDTLLQYTTDTLPGSSGSPVLDWRWQLVALHHAGGDLVEPRTGRTYFRNEGIRMSAIRADLQLPEPVVA